MTFPVPLPMGDPLLVSIAFDEITAAGVDRQKRARLNGLATIYAMKALPLGNRGGCGNILSADPEGADHSWDDPLRSAAFRNRRTAELLDQRDFETHEQRHRQAFNRGRKRRPRARREARMAAPSTRTEERRVGKVSVRVDHGGRRISKKKKT